jgi:thiamine-monophosphate kinase
VRLSDLGEFGFIHRITPGCIVEPERVVMGIGDDCAVTLGENGYLNLVTTDLLIERIHFVLDFTTGYQLGQKAMAVNLSDIAAMGGTPRDAVVSIAIPKHVDVQFLDELYRGLKAMARRHGLNILGGDTSRSEHDLILSVTMTGRVREDQVLYRAGARPGDRIFVTGYLGDSAGGMHAVVNHRLPNNDNATTLAARYREPLPHVRQGQAIAATGLASAMIDISDGLSADLTHVCTTSGVGCVIDTHRLPLSSELKAYCEKTGLDPIALALYGGEDYVLLCTGDAELGASLRTSGADAIEIGDITDGKERVIRRTDGTHEQLGLGGWDHFRSER